MLGITATVCCRQPNARNVAPCLPAPLPAYCARSRATSALRRCRACISSTRCAGSTITCCETSASIVNKHVVPSLSPIGMSIGAPVGSADRAILGARHSPSTTRAASAAAREADMTTEALVIADATEADFDAITAIYGHHVRHGLASFEEEAPSRAEMLSRWKTVRALGLPYIVARLRGRVAGYSYATSYRPRPAYRHTVEN